MDMTPVIVGHNAPLKSEFDFHKQVTDYGSYVAFDGWGTDVTPNDLRPGGKYDKYADAIKDVIADPYRLSRVLFSQDVFQPSQLRKSGGFGYAHIIRDLVPVLLRRGISGNEIRVITSDNAMKVLAISMT